MKHAVVVGSGPAGLMAAETLVAAGLRVTVIEAKPSVGRKFLMAGKSGLNLTKAEDPDTLMGHYTEAQAPLDAILRSFDADAVQAWATGLEQEIFTGSTGRVFPKAMKASPLLRAWLARLADHKVEILTRTRWTGWAKGGVQIQRGEDAPETLAADVVILALGGASWARLGSDGAWAQTFADNDLAVAPFQAANAGIQVDWSSHMAAHFGTALKGIALASGPYRSRGEALISSRGLEGGGIYSISRGVREGHRLTLDLAPDQTIQQITQKLDRPRGKMSVSNFLRKALKLGTAQIALLQEMHRPLPSNPPELGNLIKSLRIKNTGVAPMDEAISTAGGVPFASLDAGLMLTDRPGTFVVGEMLDWEAPTGGYLITACLATGRWAGQHAATWANA